MVPKRSNAFKCKSLPRYVIQNIYQNSLYLDPAIACCNWHINIFLLHQTLQITNELTTELHYKHMNKRKIQCFGEAVSPMFLCWNMLLPLVKIGQLNLVPPFLPELASLFLLGTTCISQSQPSRETRGGADFWGAWRTRIWLKVDLFFFGWLKKSLHGYLM